MSVKSFKFVSPGVFINEIDNSYRPRSHEDIGPVVIGRTTRGLGLQPIKVESYSKFVELFGDTVPGGAGGDVARKGNFNSPMYGTYASKAFLAANVAPLTYIRLLGAEHPQATTDGKAGWDTIDPPNQADVANNGGAYGLFVFPDSTYVKGAGAVHSPGTGSLAAIWYCNSGSQVQLSGAWWGTAGTPTDAEPASIGTQRILKTDSNNLFTVLIKSAGGTYDETIKFSLDDQSDSYIRDKFNTNPALVSTAGEYYASTAHKPYWLGETYDAFLRYRRLTGVAAYGAIYPITLSGSNTTGPHEKRVASQEAKAGWFIGQDLSGDPSSFVADAQQKLFRLIGRGHGEWLHKNCKVSIEKIKQSYASYNIYNSNNNLINESIFDGKNSTINRFENAYYIYHENKINSDNELSIGLRNVNHQNYKNKLLPSLSYLYKLEGLYNLRFTYGSGYRLPSIKELYYKWEAHSPAIYGSPNLSISNNVPIKKL